jgi:hypothetical protein
MAAVAALLLSAGTGVCEVTSTDDGIEFRYEDPSAGSVSLAGDFNGWNMNANPMTQADGVWTVVVDLDPGTYEYKFVVNGSDWIADPGNPKVVGAYGNSQLVIDGEGEVVEEGGAAAISNTRVNSRVMLNGWYRATYETQSDVPDDPRWRLNRPDHEVYLSVKPTVTSQVKGDATLRIATGEGDIKEISADFYSGNMEFKGGPFNVTGYYNEERIQFDDPLESIGHRDLEGSIPEEHIPFGRGTQGVILDLSFFDADLEAVYANQYEADITNDPSIYDNTDTDLLAGRLKRDFGPVGVGATFTSWRDGWWMDWTGTNYSPDLEAFIDSTGSTSTWFELANSENLMGVDLSIPVGERFTVMAEGAYYSYDSRWDMGNEEQVEGEDYSNGPIDVEAGTMDGFAGVGIIEGKVAEPVDLRLEYQMFSTDGMDADEEYTSFGAPHFTQEYEFLSSMFTREMAERTYTEVRYDGSPLIASVWGPMPELGINKLEFDGEVTFGIFDLGLEFDWIDYDMTFADSMVTVVDSTSYSFGDWQGSSTRLAGRARANIIPERFWLEVEAQKMSYDEELDLTLGGESVTDVELMLHNEMGIYERLETIIRARYEFTENWSVLADLRSISYDVPTRVASADTTDRVETSVYEYDSESFFDPYLAVIYSPRKNIEVRVSYGINPSTYIDTPVEGRANGREVWRRNYLWEHSAYDMIDAEKALEDAKTIGVMAVITF